MDVLIGLDLGTTSTKAVAVDKQGRVVAIGRQSYRMHTPQPGYAEHDPEDVYQAALHAIKSACSQLSDHHVLAVGISSAMHGIVGIDQNGNPLTPHITWADNRSHEEATALRQSPEGLLFHHATGTSIHPMTPLSKLTWISRHHPELHSRVWKWISLKTLLTFRLFGRCETDWSLASATGLFSIHNLDWWPDALHWAGIKRHQLADPVSPRHVLRGIDTALAADLGLLPDTPFVMGGSDGCLANLGVGATESGLAAVSIGTSGAIRSVSTEPRLDPEGRLFCYILDEGQYVVGGPMNNGGVVYQWFRDSIMRPLIEGTDPPSAGMLNELDNKADAIEAGAEDLLFFPYIFGERAPLWDARMRGAFVGLTVRHTRYHMARALMEGISINLRLIANHLEALDMPLSTIFAGGGFTRSNTWLQVFTDVFNVPVVIKPSGEASAIGAAIMAMRALDIEFQPADQQDEERILAPDAASHARYRAVMDRFEVLLPAIQQASHQLSSFQAN